MQNSSESQKQLEVSIAALRKETEKQVNKCTREKDGKVEIFQQQITELEIQLRESSDQVKQKEHEMMKERAIKD